MNGQPTAQNTRECGADGDLPGFRNWANDEHIERARPDLERRPDADPALRARRRTPCRSSATPRTARSSSSGSAARTRRSRCPSCARIRVDPARRTGCSSSCRTSSSPRRPSSPTSCCPAATWGEKTGHLHQRRPHRAPLREGGRAARARRGPTSTSSSTTPGGMDFRDKDGAPARRRGTTPEAAFEAWKECTPRPALRLHRPDLRQAARRQRHPVALHRRAPRRHRARSTPTATSGPHPDYCESYGQRPGHRRAGRGDRVPGPQPRRARRCSRPAEYLPPHELPDEELPASSSSPAARSTTSTRAPRPAAHRSCRRAAPEVWVEVSADGRRRARLERGRPGRRSAPRAARVHGAAAGHRHPAGACCSCRSTTATGTPRPVIDRPGAARPRSQRADAHRLGPRVQAADLQDVGGRSRARTRVGRHAGVGAHHHRLATRRSIRTADPRHRDSAG